ncbi:hypothetical protein diail_5603 [Diaporthe ilicicola]|nr:hypothetical protein diail_5603 [Diaporthe ilicicola]
MLTTDAPHTQSSPRPASPVNSPPASGQSTARPDSPPPPGGARAVIRRRAAADQKEKIANARPNSTRAAGAGGSSSTMLSTVAVELVVPSRNPRPGMVNISLTSLANIGLYTDESPGLKVDPVVVLVLSLVFIFSVVALHSSHRKDHPEVLELNG